MRAGPPWRVWAENSLTSPRRSALMPARCEAGYPPGSRTAASRTPHGWLAGSCSTSTPGVAAILSKVASRSSVAEMDRVHLTLGEHCREGVSVLLGAARMRLRQHDPDLGLAVGGEGDPAEAAVGDFVAHRQAEGVAIEDEGGVWVVDEDVHCAE